MCTATVSQLVCSSNSNAPVTSSMEQRHTLILVNPGHFHAALTLRKRHPLLSDEVYVYAEDGPELRDFLRLVASFNQRRDDPTSWVMHVYRGHDYMDALVQQLPGDVAVVAGKNDSKLSTIQRLHQAGVHVLGDKTWVTNASQLALLRDITASPPLVMDIMTERFEIATRLQQALSTNQEVFGGFRQTGNEPAVYFKSVHHLYKEVNGEPLVRPAWYFDTGTQGEGITDVTTHLVDLAQWLVNGESGSADETDVILTGARQWPTSIPLETFSRITGLSDFPAEIQRHVSNGALQYLCNANIRYRLGTVAVEIDSIWDLAIPEGGGDTHYCVLRGTHADLVVDQGPASGFKTRLRVVPTRPGDGYDDVLTRALLGLQRLCPGVQHEADGEGYLVLIPVASHHGHEARFADVLNQFLDYVNAGKCPQDISLQLVTKYTLLANAYELSHR